MKPNELRELSMEELKDKVHNLQEELFNLRFQHGTNQLENPMRMKLTKKDIARTKTVIRQKEQSEAGK